jgi:hypothetical protein
MMMVLLSSRSGRSMVRKQPGDVRIVVWFQLQNSTRGGAKCWMKYGSVGRLLTKINFRHVNCNVVGVLYARTDKKK